MSKNKNNYSGFYASKREKEEHEDVVQSEEVAATEEVTEDPAGEEKKEEPEVETFAPKKEEKFAIVTNSPKVNMRYKPNKSSQVINILPEKARVKVLEETNEEWWKIHYKGYTGYMMTKYLKRV